jgi:hypothetical protein
VQCGEKNHVACPQGRQGKIQLSACQFLYYADPHTPARKASGAYYIRHNLSGLVDYTDMTRLSYVGLLPEVPGTGAGKDYN